MADASTKLIPCYICYRSITFELVQQMCKKRGVGSIRIDTDANNEIMKHLLTKNGFSYCGLIRFDNSDKIAYEKML